MGEIEGGVGFLEAFPVEAVVRLREVRSAHSRTLGLGVFLRVETQGLFGAA